jgi:hypothetical protein
MFFNLLNVSIVDTTLGSIIPVYFKEKCESSNSVLSSSTVLVVHLIHVGATTKK